MAKIKWKTKKEIEEEKRKTKKPSLEERVEALELLELERIFSDIEGGIND